MPTKNPRDNITFEDDSFMELLSSLTKPQSKSVTGLAKELILEALERHEDLALSTVAEERDTDEPKKRVSHKDAWK